MIKLITAEEARNLKNSEHLSWRQELLQNELAKVDLEIRSNLKYNVDEISYTVGNKLIVEEVAKSLEEVGYKVTYSDNSKVIYIGWEKEESNEE